MNGRIALVQGLYFLITGVWPLLSIDTFQRVTGPKTDLWLVKTVGVIVAIIGIALLAAQVSGDQSLTILIIGMGSAAGLAGIDIIYVTKGVISPIYLLDAVIEIGLMGWWIMAGAQGLFSGGVLWA